MGAWAYEFASERSLAEMEAILDGAGPGYRCLVEMASRSGQHRASVDPILVGALGRLPVTDLVEVEPGEWPFD